MHFLTQNILMPKTKWYFSLSSNVWFFPVFFENNQLRKQNFLKPKMIFCPSYSYLHSEIQKWIFTFHSFLSPLVKLNFGFLWHVTNPSTPYTLFGGRYTFSSFLDSFGDLGLFADPTGLRSNGGLTNETSPTLLSLLLKKKKKEERKEKRKIHRLAN